ncbi:hypothetical protein CP533_1381 [Ophiocordyceps camponoti-saundersi (nom. inval.)]|nr:hypothetical protein CP533_1381 [Ophiocordyceps camponoti-saundersi (nom. inval.)]
MASRPRRSAAARAKEFISVHAKWADASDKSDRAMASRRSGRTSGAALHDAPSSPSDSHISVNVKSSSSSKSARGNARRSERFEGGQIVSGTRNRGGRKNYVIESSDDEEDEVEVEDDEMDDEDVGDEDAEGEEMELDAEGDDVDAEGDDDAEGDVDVITSVAPSAPTIRVSQPSTSRPAARAAAHKIAAERADEEDDEDDDEDEEDDEDDDEDDEELSEPGESDVADQTLGLVDETMADEDAEGEEIEVAGEEGEAEGPEQNSEDDGSRDGSPDLTKMTKRQRARFEEPQEYMKLSDEVQVKKHFTAEELSMRRQEMARRRRNLSEKRTEEVKMETINKLLKKQAPKTNRKGAAAASSAAATATSARGTTPDSDEPKPDPMFIRWVNRKDGSVLSVPGEMLSGPVGCLFMKEQGLASGKMAEEVT